MSIPSGVQNIAPAAKNFGAFWLLHVSVVLQSCYAKLCVYYVGPLYRCWTPWLIPSGFEFRPIGPRLAPAMLISWTHWDRHLVAQNVFPVDAVIYGTRLFCYAANCIPLLIQQNVDGSNFFNRSWAEFKVGFNDLRGNYWLGNERLHELTYNSRYKLRLDLQAQNLSWFYAEYSSFVVFSEESNYKMSVSGYSGNAGDAFLAHDGLMRSACCRALINRTNLLSASCLITNNIGLLVYDFATF